MTPVATGEAEWWDAKRPNHHAKRGGDEGHRTPV